MIRGSGLGARTTAFVLVAVALGVTVSAQPAARRPTNIAQPESPRRVVIRVRGHLGPTLLEAFRALTADREDEDTLLSGPLPRT